MTPLPASPMDVPSAPGNPRRPSMPPFQVVATVSSLAPGGDGVALVELDGERRAVFIPHTVPGDRARVVVDASRRPARGRVVALESAGPDRVDPACAWSTQCGGCDWMQLAVGAQARTHVDHLRAALPAAWRDRPIESSHAPRALAYRTRARVHVKSDGRGRVRVGMHEIRTHEPVEVEACAVLDPRLEGARRSLPLIFGGSRGRGDVQLALGASRLVVLDVKWEGLLPDAVFGRIESAVAEGAISGAEVTLGDARRPARIGDPTPWITGADGTPLQLPPGGFSQAFEAMNATLANHVAALVRRLRVGGVDRAVELYAGAGNLSVVLAREAGELVCVESSRRAVEAARANLAARHLDNVRVVEADAETYTWSKAVKLVVLDPPRAGARAVAQRLAESRVANVVYVSCDPQTLGRDLRILEATYEPTSVAALEMFPQTSHVEVVVGLQRRSA